ncbi:MAG: general secretion pathway protein GspB [Proteobacteria bacterium]|nr:general secretion pathway protein GspB [Pseudomonadota bacterium]MDA0992137.1 general secretion pathway protein GspB [Pseudomonadota bacterium]
MSFILDALKKSETERLRKDAPGISSIPQRGRQKPSSKWMWLVLALIMVNLLVLAGLLFKVGRETSTVETRVTDILPETEVAPALQVSQTVPIIERTRPDAMQDQPATVPLQQRFDPGTSGGVVPTPALGGVTDGLENFNDLRAKGVFRLPDMHVDIHVYSADPAERFVFVNMSKYKENATLAEGPIVSEITPDGVVLQYQGSTFLLPRE